MAGFHVRRRQGHVKMEPVEHSACGVDRGRELADAVAFAGVRDPIDANVADDRAGLDPVPACHLQPANHRDEDVGPAPFTLLALDEQAHSKTYKLYGEVSYAFAPKLKAIAGLRNFNQRFDETYDSISFGVPGLNGVRSRLRAAGFGALTRQVGEGTHASPPAQWAGYETALPPASLRANVTFNPGGARI